MNTDVEQLTQIFAALEEDEPGAADRLLAAVYGELKVIARSQMAREPAGHTLQPTALVHEAYLRLVGDDVRWENRAHFFGAAAEAMRRILVERARRVGRLKRGGGARQVTLDEALASVDPRPEELLAVDRALDRLAALDPRMAEVVKLRYFAGLTVEETARTVGSSQRTVYRQWTAAKAWLRRELEGSPAP